jgi:hypothetical protein
MVREFEEKQGGQEEKILLAQGMHDSHSTGYQGEFLGSSSHLPGKGIYKAGEDLQGGGIIVDIERADANSCKITLNNSAKLHFHNDHIEKIERPDGSTFEMKYKDGGGLQQITTPAGDTFVHKDGHWYSEDGKKTDRNFGTNQWGSVFESSYKDNGPAAIYYPDGTSVSGHYGHTADGTYSTIDKIEKLGQLLVACQYDKDHALKQFKLGSGEEWTKQGPMKWKSNKGETFEGNFYFEKGRQLRRSDRAGQIDYSFSPY